MSKMPSGTPGTKITTTKLAEMKRKGRRITALTAYDAPTARLLNEAANADGVVDEREIQFIYCFMRTAGYEIDI